MSQGFFLRKEGHWTGSFQPGLKVFGEGEGDRAGRLSGLVKPRGTSFPCTETVVPFSIVSLLSAAVDIRGE
jgi:hypothetical protein